MAEDLAAARRALASAKGLSRQLSFVTENRPITRGDVKFSELGAEFDSWKNEAEAAREIYSPRIAMIVVEGGQGIATAWPCGPGRMATAGHVLSWFMPDRRQLFRPTGFPAEGIPADQSPQSPPPFMRPAWVQWPDGRQEPILRWVCASGCCDLVVFEVQHGLDPLPLRSSEDPIGEALCVIGYPQVNPGRQFPDPFRNLGFCSLGLMREAEQGERPPAPGTFFHDATTEAGYSGAPVVDLSTNTVVGLHVWGNFSHDWNDAVDLHALEPWMVEAMQGDAPTLTGNERAWPWVGAGVAAESVPALFGAVVRQRPPPPAPSLLAGVVADRADGRDRPYVPQLALARDTCIPEPAPFIGDQGTEGSCAAFALAAAIEVQLAAGKRAGDGTDFTASVRMLDRMARRHDEWVDDSQQGTSLRAVVKGFFHNGVCTSGRCPYHAGERAFLLSRDMAKEARNITLGSYFRVAGEITDLQMAVQEAGAVIVSAHIHAGWKRLTRKGLIPFNPGRVPTRIGTHAFVVTGYGDDGFVVQNSWGPQWGGWDKRPGHAVWTYEDWGHNVLDAWVIRLAPHTSRSFGITARTVEVTEASGPDALPLPRRSHLIGHVARSERWGLTEEGDLGMGLAAMTETARWLATPAADYRQLVLVFHDPLLGEETITRLAHHLNGRMKTRRFYPFHVVHGLDEMQTCRLRLLHEIGIAATRFSDTAPEREAYLGRALAPILRPLLNAYEDGAETASWEDLGVGLQLLIRAAAETKRTVAIMSAGLGAIPARACAAALPELKQAPHLTVAPVVDVTKAKVRHLRRSRGEGPIPGYRGDWPDLVAGMLGGEPRSASGRHGTLCTLMARGDLPGAMADLLRGQAERQP